MEYIDTYKQLSSFMPETFRSKLRKIALGTIAASFKMRHNQEDLLRRPRIQFLYIHHIFRDEEGKLEQLLKSLSRQHQFISYTEAVRRILNGEIDKPYICISSDDGLKNNLAAASIMNEYGAKGCFFICPSIIDEKDPEKIRSFAKTRLHFPPVEFMTWKDVEQLQQQGHEIGAHTLSHINIAATPATELDEEIAGCYEIIMKKCGNSDHFAYPYGRYSDFTQYARDLTFKSGFESFASAARGCHITDRGMRMDKKDLLIRRDHVILDWPLRHILFFIARNSLRADVKNNYF